MSHKHRRILIVLSSLRAEGTPRLTLDLCLQWKKLGLDPHVVVLFSLPSDLAELYQLSGIQVEVLGWPPSGWRRYYQLFSRVRALCKAGDVFGVVCMPLGWHAFAAAAAWTCKIPAIAHAGNAPEPAWSGAWLKFIAEVQLARPFTRYVVCCSQYVRATILRAFRLRSDEAITIPNGIDVSAWHVVYNTEVRPEQKMILMVGTLEAHKDQSTLIRAMPAIIVEARRRGSQVRLVLVGDGSMRRTLDELVAHLGVGDQVLLEGSSTKIKETMQQASLFAFSTTPREGQGIALLEAMASGVPIVASDVGACREVLDGGACGVLVRAGDHAGFATEIINLLWDTERSKSLAKCARRRVTDYYDVSHVAARYADLLRIEK